MKWQTILFITTIMGLLLIGGYFATKKNIKSEEKDIGATESMGIKRLSTSILEINSTQSEVLLEIVIVNQSGIDEYITFNFTRVNETQFNGALQINQVLWDSVKACQGLNPPSNKINCLNNLSTFYFPNMTISQVVNQLQNLTNYPAKNLSNSWYFSNFAFNLTSGTGIFKVNFPNGFQEGELAKLGFNSTFVASNKSSGNSDPDISWFNVTSTDNTILFLTATLSAGGTINNVTYNGTNMSRVNTTGAGGPTLDMWYLLNPDNGLHNFTIDWTQGHGNPSLFTSVLYSGVNQVTPLGQTNRSFATTSEANITVSSASGELVVGVLGYGCPRKVTITANGTGQTSRVAGATGVCGGQVASVFYDKDGASGNVPLNATFNQSADWRMVAVSVKPATVGDDCTCTDGAPWIIDDGSTCVLTTSCNLGNNPFRILDGALRISSTGKLNALGCYVQNTESLFIQQGGGLICRA